MIRADRTWLTPQETQPGPSPWMVCARPSCGLVFRRLSFIAIEEPAQCPMCGDVVSTRTRGRRLTRLLRRALVASARQAWRHVAPAIAERRAA